MTCTFVQTHLLLLLHTYLTKIRNGKNNLQQNSLTIVDLMICVIVKFISLKCVILHQLPSLHPPTELRKGKSSWWLEKTASIQSKKLSSDHRNTFHYVLLQNNQSIHIRTQIGSHRNKLAFAFLFAVMALTVTKISRRLFLIFR